MLNNLKTINTTIQGNAVHHLSFIESLISQGMITSDQVYIAQIEAKKLQKPLDILLVELGFISDDLMKEMKAQATGELIFYPQKTSVDPKVLRYFSKDQAQSLKALPLFLQDNILHIAVCEVENLKIFDRLKEIYGPATEFCPYIATVPDLLEAIDTSYSHPLSVRSPLSLQEENLFSSDSVAQTQVIQFLETIFEEAVKKRASDIHFEPEERFVCVRYRIDGVLKQICAFHQQFWPRVCVRIKILSHLNIAESRLPRDGRFGLRVLGREIDIRVSCLPTQYGENIVMRLLDKRYSLRSLADLGFDSIQEQKIKKLTHHPEGILIVTGPTGSGKTTTLYSIVQDLATDSINIMTLEDPIEYELKRIRQTEVREEIGLNFYNGVRAILRQDPDIILIGEIRDEATAKMAIRASMTGHLVLTTLHAQTASGVFSRLYELGLSPSLLEGNMRGIMAQRLLRKLCLNCRKKSIHENRITFKAQGCEECAYTGYKGRTCIAEILPMNAEVEALMSSYACAQEIEKKVRLQGVTSLLDNAYEKVYAGETSFEEIQRVLGTS